MLCGEATGNPISPISSLQGLREAMFGGRVQKVGDNVELSVPCVEKGKT